MPGFLALEMFFVFFNVVGGEMQLKPGNLAYKLHFQAQCKKKKKFVSSYEIPVLMHTPCLISCCLLPSIHPSIHKSIHSFIHPYIHTYIHVCLCVFLYKKM